MKEIKIWLRYCFNSFQQVIVNRLAGGFLLVGKIIRVGLFLVFLTFLFQGTKSLAGYSREQIIFFYLSFNLIDTLAQFFFREVYRFRDLVISGNLDLVLIKPSNPLTRVLLGGADLLDLVMLLLLSSVVVWYGVNYLNVDGWRWLIFSVLVLNGLLIAAALHIFVLGIDIMTTSVDHLVMIYRDLTSMMRIPVDLYIEPIRALLTFVVPLGIMITFPAKGLLGLLSVELLLLALLFSVISLGAALYFWKFSLKYYTSDGS